MATLNDILTFSRTQAQTDANGLTDSIGLTFANEALSDFHRRLIDKGVDASQLQEAYTDATSGQGTYAYPVDMLWLKAIELNYSGNQNGYRTASQVDVSNLAGWASFTDMRLNADPFNPLFDDHGDWFEIFPTPKGTNNLSQMMRIFYFLKPTAYTNTASTVAYPESQDISILGWRIAAMYYYSLNKMVEGDAFNVKYDERVRQYISTLGRGSQQPIEATAITWTGFQF